MLIRVPPWLACLSAAVRHRFLPLLFAGFHFGQEIGRESLLEALRLRLVVSDRERRSVRQHHPPHAPGPMGKITDQHRLTLGIGHGVARGPVRLLLDDDLDHVLGLQIF